MNYLCLLEIKQKFSLNTSWILTEGQLMTSFAVNKQCGISYCNRDYNILYFLLILTRVRGIDGEILFTKICMFHLVTCTMIRKTKILP